MKKAAMIGLDGMSWEILNKLFQWNVMPNLHELTKKSIRGILRSTIPPESAPAWTSIATGVNPGKHGIFGFTKPSNDFSNVDIVSSRDVKYLRIHEMVATQNLKSISVNQLLTYPIKKIKGSFVITAWLSPEIKCSPEIKHIARNYHGPTLVETSPFLEKDWDAEYAEVSSRVDTVNKLAMEIDWDLFWVVYSEPDHLFHRYYDMVMKKDILRNSIMGCMLILILKSLDWSRESLNGLLKVLLVNDRLMKQSFNSTSQRAYINILQNCRQRWS